MKKVITGALLVAATLMLSSAFATGGTIGEKTKSVKVDDATLLYRTYGNKGGTPLVLLAPLGSSLDDWDPAVINGLAKYSTVVVFDNKGVGGSSGKTPGSITEMARDAVSFVRALGYSKVNLLGFSMGGFVAQEIVETEPALVNKLILVGTGPQGSEGLASIGAKLQAAGNLSPEDRFLGGLFAPTSTSRELGKASFARIYGSPANRDLPLSKESFGAEFTAVLGWAQPDSAAFARARNVPNPVLIVGGQYDFFIPVVNPLKLYQALPNARLVLLPDAGHASFFQYPDLFVQEASNFLK
jgi:pimeloyl-ACP methyl ester carboxylesterase